jgi:hypothetical protein
MSRLSLFVGDNFASCGVCGRKVFAPYWGWLGLVGLRGGVRVHGRCYGRAPKRGRR